MIHLGYVRKEQTQKQEKRNGSIVEDGITKNGWITMAQDLYWMQIGGQVMNMIKNKFVLFSILFLK